MRELGRNNAAVMGDATWFSEVHQSCFSSFGFVSSLRQQQWIQVGLRSLLWQCICFCIQLGPKQRCFSCAALHGFLMGMTLHFFLDQSKPRTDYYLAIAATCVICTIVSCWIAWLI
jgi:hypothetical protein